MNGVHELCVHIAQANADPSLGQIALTLNKAFHIGTVPRGATILPCWSHVRTAFAPACTIDVGSQSNATGLMASATIVPGTAAAPVVNIVGALSGLQSDLTALFVVMGTAQATAGAVDIVIPFIIHRD